MLGIFFSTKFAYFVFLSPPAEINLFRVGAFRSFYVLNTTDGLLKKPVVELSRASLESTIKT
jgi:hypothetical protein